MTVLDLRGDFLPPIFLICKNRLHILVFPLQLHVKAKSSCCTSFVFLSSTHEEQLFTGDESKQKLNNNHSEEQPFILAFKTEKKTKYIGYAKIVQ